MFGERSLAPLCCSMEKSNRTEVHPSHHSVASARFDLAVAYNSDNTGDVRTFVFWRTRGWIAASNRGCWSRSLSAGHRLQAQFDWTPLPRRRSIIPRTCSVQKAIAVDWKIPFEARESISALSNDTKKPHSQMPINKPVSGVLNPVPPAPNATMYFKRASFRPKAL